ncbi:MAG: 7-cyano-7-deazaguanine synthase QueC [Gammaproteobacteria bacterium]|jgi:7-cyano-7-deazaguanine synthase|nr:7-cyano-7-deazaguanine synthase QueC [Gammaproteobacteria bacterium]
MAEERERSGPLAPGEGRPVVVLLSGGLDSATVLAAAKSAGYASHAIAFDYGQKHRAELFAAARVAEAQGAESFRIIRLDAGAFSGSALTDDDLAVPESPTEGIPITYVPARNTIFLAHALGMAEALGATDLALGVNAVDYSGYPDCRPAFIDAFEALANLATKVGVESGALRVHAPLLMLTKAEIIRWGTELGVPYHLTVSCYQATEAGLACGRCDSCRLRREGFAAAGVPDPTPYR